MNFVNLKGIVVAVLGIKYDGSENDCIDLACVVPLFVCSGLVASVEC